MRLAIVLPPREAFTPAAAGGIALVVHRLARATEDVSAVVIGPETAFLPFSDVDFRPAHSLGWPPGSHVRRYSLAVARTLRNLAPDLIEVHNRPDVALFLAKRFPATPGVLFLHNDPRGMRAAASPAERRLLLQRLARVVSVSAFLRELLLDGVAASERALVLPNPIERAALPPPLPQAFRLPLILFAGRMVSDKGADAFVAAAAAALPRLPGWRAAMYGADRFGPASPETPYIVALRRRAAAAGIILNGYRPQAEVQAAMAEAAIVVVPSRWPEPFGLTALEAMAAGAALIAAPRGALPEIAGAAARYADPDDPASLAETLVALARDAPARAALAERGLARAAAFDLPRIAARLARLRADVLAS
ncbi:MAG: glycosyltransferase family 4 protein [Acetobacteraceae bacterium]